MIIERRPKILTKKWLEWLKLRLAQDIFDELEKERRKLANKAKDDLRNWKYWEIKDND